MTNRDQLVSILLRAVSDGHCLDSRADLEELADYLSANVAPVVHGRWKQIKSYATKAKYRCSVCGRTIMSANRVNMEKYPYCHCGAKMDAEG